MLLLPHMARQQQDGVQDHLYLISACQWVELISIESIYKLTFHMELRMF